MPNTVAKRVGCSGWSDLGRVSQRRLLEFGMRGDRISPAWTAKLGISDRGMLPKKYWVSEKPDQVGFVCVVVVVLTGRVSPFQVTANDLSSGTGLTGGRDSYQIRFALSTAFRKHDAYNARWRRLGQWRYIASIHFIFPLIPRVNTSEICTWFSKCT